MRWSAMGLGRRPLGPFDACGPPAVMCSAMASSGGGTVCHLAMNTLSRLKLLRCTAPSSWKAALTCHHMPAHAISNKVHLHYPL